MNFTNASLASTNISVSPCRILSDEYVVFSLISVTLNLVTLPFIVVMNVLVIIAIKTRRRLQTTYNILLASLAGTDLAVGVMSQPTFVAQEMFLLTGGTLAKYCSIYSKLVWFYLAPSLASLMLLAVLSMERFIALKFALKYASIVTPARSTVAIACSWFIAIVPALTGYTSWIILTLFPRYFSLSASFLSILAISYFHTVVYFVSRRHMKKISSELISREEIEKFLKERKALKTTTIIIGFLFLSYTPGLFFSFVRYALPEGNYKQKITAPLPPFVITCILINSFFNPFIYCLRNRELRTVIFELLSKRSEQF